MMRSILHHFFLFFIATIIQFRELQSQYYTGILAGGNGCGWTGDGGPASSAKVNSPYGIWGDTVGNIYFSEFVELRVRVINSAGIINTIIGTGVSSTSGVGGPGLSTSLDSVSDLVGDTTSNLYIAGNFFTWRYSFSTLQVVKIMGASASNSYGGDGGPATSAAVSDVIGVAISTSGTLYIVDCGNCIIRAVNLATNIITTFAGTPTSCDFSGEGGAATSAKLRYPYGIWMSSNNDLYIADAQNYRIRRVTNNIITTIAGTGSNFLGQDGVAATNSGLYFPVGVAGDSLGTIYIAEHSGCRVRAVQSGIITTVLGTGTCVTFVSTVQVATNTPVSPLRQLWVNTIGTLYVVESATCIVRYVYSNIPTVNPTPSPTNFPTVSPSLLPTYVTTASPSCLPTFQPSVTPTVVPPTYTPSFIPSVNPSCVPSTEPTFSPSFSPSPLPSTLIPSHIPTHYPTSDPSSQPTSLPSIRPSTVPSSQPSASPSGAPSIMPTSLPSVKPSMIPAGEPTSTPSTLPSAIPSSHPTGGPSSQPSSQPSSHPTSQPSVRPSIHPSSRPTSQPSVRLSIHPSSRPTSQPSVRPSIHPSSRPTSQPSVRPSIHPSSRPTSQPSVRPSIHPSSRPTSQPSVRPSMQTSSHPTSQPSVRLSIHPSSRPTSQPSVRLSIHPSSRPTSQPSVRPSMQTSQPSLLLTVSPSPGTSFPIHLATVSPSFVPNVVPFVPEARCPSLIPSQLPHPSISSAPSQFITCFPNTSSWKEVLFLFGSFSSDSQSAKVLDALSFLLSPSSIIFGSKSFSSSPLVVNVSCSSTSCHYPVAHISASYKRDTTSRAAVVPGDVNGDAYNDLIVCSPLTSLCNIYFGKEEDGLRNVMIGVTIYGPSSSSTPSSPAATFFGFSVAGAEDLNEDGLADVLVSSLTGRAVYVIYGRRSWSSMFRVSQMRSRVDGYKIVADSSTTMTGISVSGVGDMNGDGRKDVALSIQRGGLFMVYVIWGEGETGGNDLLLGEVRNGMKGFSVTGEQGYYTGLSISGVGDVNNDGLNDLLVGAIPYPDRTKNLQQKSYVILGSSARFSDLGLGGNRVDVVSIVGGGFLVSGPGDVNDDGIDDIMITNVREYLGKGNAYIISYPSRMSSSPSLVPSSFPSLVPSHPTRSQPSSSFPSSSPSSSYLSSNITSPSSLPNRITTLKPSRSFRPSNIPIIRSPNYSPAMSAVPSLRQTTRSPTVRPSFISARTNSYSPSVNPSRCRSPSIVPTLVASLAPSSHSYIVRVVNSTSLASSVIIYGMEGASERFEISSISSDGRRRSGWSGTILGGRGRKVYVIYPKDSSQPMNRIILEDFEKKSDVLDLSHISHIRSRVDLTYRTNPLTLFLPDNQKIVLSSYQTMNDLKDENFLFQSDTSSSSSTSSSKVSLKELSLIVPLFGAMIVLLVWISPFSVCNKDDENKEVDNIGIYRDEDMTEDKHKQVHQVMNVNNIEDVGEAREEVHHINNHVEKLNKDSIREYDEESLLTLPLPINILNHSHPTIHKKDDEIGSSDSEDWIRETLSSFSSLKSSYSSYSSYSSSSPSSPTYISRSSQNQN